MDNYYTSCPPRMQDGGRHLGDFQSSVRRNEHIRHILGINRDDEYRLFLQQNGKKILDKQWETYKCNNSCWEN